MPRDVSVVGFGDHGAAAVYTPRLTTVRVPAQQAGERAAQLIVGRIEHGPAHLNDRLNAVFMWAGPRVSLSVVRATAEADAAVRDRRQHSSQVNQHQQLSVLQPPPTIGLDSYDRLFPNQDTMPQGGFANLIDDDFVPRPANWHLQRVFDASVESSSKRIVQKAERRGRVLAPPSAPGRRRSRAVDGATLTASPTSSSRRSC